MSESLNFTIERLKLYFLRNQLRCELIIKNMDLTAEDLNSLLDLSENYARRWLKCFSRVGQFHRAQRLSQ